LKLNEKLNETAAYAFIEKFQRLTLPTYDIPYSGKAELWIRIWIRIRIRIQGFDDQKTEEKNMLCIDQALQLTYVRAT
jgi:hypothetical protein